MAEVFDTIIVGAGHNGLIAGAYLAKAGQKVLILEEKSWIGGGVVTEELTVPGFRHDVHSSNHIFIQANPLISKDELGLLSRFGLRYIYPDVVFSTIFDDQTSICNYRDVDRTCQSISAISLRDADAYRKFAKKSAELLPVLEAGLFVPPAPQGPFWALLDQSAQGRELMRAAQSSALDVLTELFESEKVILHYAKFISEALAAPEETGTGIMVYTMPGFMHKYPAGLPEGGSAGLIDALLRCLNSLGAVVRNNTAVEKVVVEAGRASGVRLTTGETIRAKTAVIGTIHPLLLDRFVDGLGAQLLANTKRVKMAPFTVFYAHYALQAAPQYYVGGDAGNALLVGFVPTDLQSFRQIFDSYRYGEPFTKAALMTAMVHSRHDPSRCPAGKATLNVLGFAPYDLRDGGADAWDGIKEKYGKYLLNNLRHYVSNLSDTDILGSKLYTPRDLPRFSPTFQNGDVGGVGKYLTQFGGHRPTPELSQFSVPGVERLYLTGTFMHPGGGVAGTGRATAQKICRDLSIDFTKVAA